MPRPVWHGRVTNTQQTYRPLTNTSKPALRDQAGQLAAVWSGRFGTTGLQKLSMITTTSTRAIWLSPGRLLASLKCYQALTSRSPSPLSSSGSTTASDDAKASACASDLLISTATICGGQYRSFSLAAATRAKEGKFW